MTCRHVSLGTLSKRGGCRLERGRGRHSKHGAWRGLVTMLKRILQFGALALLLVPGAAFADSFNLAGGTWTESGGSFTLIDGTTTLKTGDINSFFFFGSSGDTGSVGTTALSCSDCVKTDESLTLTGFFIPTIA